MSVVRRLDLRHDRPRVRVGRRFAGEIRASSSAKAASMSSGSNMRSATICSSASTSVTHSARRNASRLGSPARPANDREGETLPAGRDDGRRSRPTPKSAIARISAISASRPCRTPAFTTRRRSSLKMSSANMSGHRRPSRGPRSPLQEALAPLGLPRFPAAAPAGAARQSWRARRRGLSRRRARTGRPGRLRMSKSATSRHSASKPSCEVPARYYCDDHPSVAQPVHSLEVELDVGATSQGA